MKTKTRLKGAMACCVVSGPVIGMLNKEQVGFPSERISMSIHKNKIVKNEIDNLCFIIILHMESNRYDKLSSIDQRDFKK